MASGLMVMCVGNFTRLNPWLTQADKTYEATVRLGATSNTDDDEGVISPLDESFEPSLERVNCVLDQFRGK